MPRSTFSPNRAGQLPLSPPSPPAPGCPAAPPSIISDTRESLVTATLEQIFADLTAVTAQATDTNGDRIAAVVDRAVGIYTGKEFKAALRAGVGGCSLRPGAARTNPAARSEVRPRGTPNDGPGARAIGR